MPEHKNLAAALVAFQAEVPTLVKDATNPHFKSRFTPLDTIVETVSPLLAKHGLSWSAFPCFGPNGEPALRYKLSHVSGDCESETMPLLVTKPDPQGMGSAITYGRRYSLSSVLNLVSDDDDDGNSASRSSAARAADRVALVNAAGIDELKASAKGLTNGDIRAAFEKVGVQYANAGSFNRVPQVLAAELALELSAVPR